MRRCQASPRRRGRRPGDPLPAVHAASARLSAVADVPTILARHYVSCAGGPKLFVPSGSRPEPEGADLEETHRRTGSGRWIDRSADHSCRYCIGLLRRGGLCSERDAQRRRGHALRSSTAVRLWPGLQLENVRVCHDGRLATGRIPGRSARSRAAVRRDKRVGAGPQRGLVDMRTDKRQLAVGEPRRYTGAAAVRQRGTRLSFRTGLSPVVRKGEPMTALPAGSGIVSSTVVVSGGSTVYGRGS
ncbi:MAG: hypothetical protein QOE41_3248 [Mycobacterium sp.]|nr:hypothetical protein [Mycobacterium sp.]